MSTEGGLTSTREFWNSNPCGTHDGFDHRSVQRYRMERWLPTLLTVIGDRRARMLEVGCGQGTDAVFICKFLKDRSQYFGIDYSESSVTEAKSVLNEQVHRDDISIDISVGNAEKLAFDENYFDLVFF